MINIPTELCYRTVVPLSRAVSARAMISGACAGYWLVFTHMGYFDILTRALWHSINCKTTKNIRCSLYKRC